MEVQNNIVLGIVGNRGTGKTDFLKSLLKASNLPKKLVVDTFDSPVWHTLETWDDPGGANIEVPILTPEQMPYWKSGTYRMFDPDTDILMDAVQKYAMNSLVIFEDATKYIGTTLTKDVKRFILDSKQKNLNLLFVFHSLKDLPRDLIRVMDYITVCKTGDYRYTSGLRNKFPDSVEQAYNEVMNSKDKYAKVTLQITS